MNTWLNISLSNISYNIKQIKKLIGKDKEIIAVVKSNAYGHGLVPVSKAAVKAGAKMLAVINIEEAMMLRKSGVKAPILVLGAFEKEEIKYAARHKIDLVVFDKNSLSGISKSVFGPLNVHLKIDTGMGRLGLMPNEVLDVARGLRKNRNIKIRGVMTHFCCADLKRGDLIKKQISIFAKTLKTLREYHIFPEIIHLENSAAVLRHIDLHGFFTDGHGRIYVRPGLAIYGLAPFTPLEITISNKARRSAFLTRFADNKNVLKLKPALRWKAKVIQTKTLPNGHCVSYGCDFKTKKPTKIAVLPVGYYEGYDRGLSNCGEVLIKGKRASIIGRVTMNYIMVDVTDIYGAKVGDEAVLIGKQGREEITADELAKKINTINYEILTRINPLIRRLFN